MYLTAVVFTVSWRGAGGGVVRKSSSAGIDVWWLHGYDQNKHELHRATLT